jgi:hypothetical protein
MQHGPGLTIGNVRSVAGVIDIVGSRVQNTRGCGLAIYKKEAIQTQVLLDTVSFQNVAQGYPLGPVHPRRACDPTGACNPIIIVGGTDKLNAPEAAMGGIAFEGPCVIHDRLDRPFLRAGQNAVFALEQVRGSFEVFNPFGCSVMVQKNQTGVSLNARCHNDSVDMTPSKSDDGSAGAGSSVANYPFTALWVDKPGSPKSHDVDALERALHLVTSRHNASYTRVAASAGMEGAGGGTPLEPWAPELHDPAIAELKMDGGKASSPGVGNGNIVKSGDLQRRPLRTTTLFASGSCDTRGVCYSCFRIPSIIVLDTRTLVAFVEARGPISNSTPFSCLDRGRANDRRAGWSGDTRIVSRRSTDLARGDKSWAFMVRTAHAGNRAVAVFGLAQCSGARAEQHFVFKPVDARGPARFTIELAGVSADSGGAAQCVRAAESGGFALPKTVGHYQGYAIAGEEFRAKTGHKTDDNQTAAMLHISKSWVVRVDLHLPEDAGQALGTLFELAVGDSVIGHAGCPYYTNTYYSNQHREVVWYVSPDADEEKAVMTSLGNPFPNVVSEVRLTTFEGRLLAFTRALSGNNTAVLIDSPEAMEGGSAGPWRRIEPPRGTSPFQGSLSVCGGHISYEETRIAFDGHTIFDGTPLAKALYSHYHDGLFFIFGYGPAPGSGTIWTNTLSIGEWQCGSSAAMRITHTFADPSPVSLQEHNFPYTFLYVGAGVFVTGTNIGNVYRISQHGLQIVRNAGPDPISWQPYSMLRSATVLMGQYPTGGVFEYHDNGTAGRLLFSKNNVGHEPNSLATHREAMTLGVYEDSVLVGCWPWGSVWGQEQSVPAANWTQNFRLFQTPSVSPDDAAWVSQIAAHIGPTCNNTNPAVASCNYSNAWGQRVSDMTLYNGDMYFVTSAKNFDTDRYGRWMIAKDDQHQYGRVHRLRSHTQASGHFTWRQHTTLEFVFSTTGMSIVQDGQILGYKNFTKPLHLAEPPTVVRRCRGLFGPCPAGVHVTVHPPSTPSEQVGRR